MRLRIFCGVMLLLLSITPTAAQESPPGSIDSILNGMTLEQKVAQMFLVGLFGPTLNEPGRDFLQEWQPGGVVLFVSNAGTPEAVTSLINSWQQTVVDVGGVPMFVSTDQEGGMIERLKDGFTQWPVPMLLTASGNVDLAYRTGLAMAEELRAVGVNMNLAPVADLYTNLYNPVIGRRSFGSDPERTGRMLAALIRGMQAGGIMATAKHFPGHGDTDHDSHTSLPVVQYPIDELQRVEFAPFRWTIAAGVESMMVAHIWYPALDSERLPASLSSNVVTGLLRNEMEFRGLVMTDAIEMDAIDTVYGYGEASVMAINAGVDIVAFGAHLSPNAQAQAIQTVIDAVRNGEIPESRINESVRRILDAKSRYGILNWTPLEPTSAPIRVKADVHAELVNELFKAGVTIAYDRSGILPLDDTRRVLLIYPATRSRIKQACAPLHPVELTSWTSVSDSPGADEINGAVRSAFGADVVVVFTQNAGNNTDQQSLVNQLPKDKTVAVALFSPYDWQAFPDVSAYLTTYSPLDPGIPAVCEVLFGEIPARGQLPVALDGQRDFASFVATEGIVINAENGGVLLAPRITVTPLPTLTPLIFTPVPTDSTPLPTPTITNTRAPLSASTRVAAAPTNAANVPTVLAIIPPEAVDSALTIPLIAGVVGLVLSFGLYGRLYVLGTRAAKRYQSGFVIDECPACGHGQLRVKTVTQRLFGIPYQSRHTVHCDHCKSVMRQTAPGKWKYRLDTTSHLYAQFNNKTLTEAQISKLNQR